MVKRINRNDEYLAVIRKWKHNEGDPSHVRIVKVLHSDEREVKQRYEEDKPLRFVNAPNRLPWYECETPPEHGDVICRFANGRWPAFIVNRGDLFETWDAARILSESQRGAE